MKIFFPVFFAFIIFAFGCERFNLKPVSPPINEEKSDYEEPLKVSICELQKNPAGYNHKLIEVTGFVSHGYEDSAIFDPLCPTKQCIWMEYGGKTTTETIYCCYVSAERKRTEPLVVEEISIPLLEDENFRKFDELLHRPPDAIAHATIQGRFFSGEKSELINDETYRGYGHEGACSLFAIQKVVSVDSQEADLDYRSSVDDPDDKYINSGYDILEEERALEIQKKADNGEATWRFNSPKETAIKYLADRSRIKENSILGLKEISKSQGRVIYHWKNKSDKKLYMIVVSRPYWLSFYSKVPNKVVWFVRSAYRINI